MFLTTGTDAPPGFGIGTSRSRNTQRSHGPTGLPSASASAAVESPSPGSQRRPVQSQAESPGHYNTEFYLGQATKQQGPHPRLLLPPTKHL